MPARRLSEPLGGGLRRWIVLLIVLLVSVSASYLLVGLVAFTNEQDHGNPVPARPTTNPPSAPFASAHGRHLLAVTIIASDCGWSSHPSTMKAIGSVRRRLTAEHGERYAKVSVVGVVLDEDLETGMRFLRDIAGTELENAFDQLVMGGSWLNEQLMQLVWRNPAIEAATPQLILVERTVDTSAYESIGVIGAGEDIIVGNIIGAGEIEEWIEQQVPIRPDAVAPR